MSLIRHLPLPLLLALGAGSAHADLLLGAQVGRQQLSVEERVNGSLVNDDDLRTRTALALVIGAGTPGADGARVSLGGASHEFSGGGDLDLLTLGYQQMLPAFNPEAGYRLRPFFGVDLGFGRLARDAQPLFGRARDSGLTTGVTGGLNLALGGKAELELGLRYSRLDLEVEQQGLGGAATTRLRDNRAWWVGFNVGL